MVYSFNISTPANTLSSDPKISIVTLQSGLIYRMETYFPPGPSGLVGVAVFDANVQIYPSNRENWFIGDDVLYGFNDRYMFTTSTEVLMIKTYNEDTYFDHDVIINIGLLVDQAYIDSIIVSTPLDTLTAAIGDLIGQLKAQTATQTTKSQKILGTTPVVGS